MDSCNLFNTLRPKWINAILQTTFSNAFSWVQIYDFYIGFHWSLFTRFELTILHHWFRQWLGAGQATNNYLNQWLLVYWHIFALLGLNELTVSFSRDTWGSIYKHGLTLIPAWISDYIHHKVCDEMTYPFPNFKGESFEVWEWIRNLISRFTWHMIIHSCWV